MLVALAALLALKGLVRALLVKHLGHEGTQTAFVPDKPSLAVLWLSASTQPVDSFHGCSCSTSLSRLPKASWAWL